jgi:hypothetical protein
VAKAGIARAKIVHSEADTELPKAGKNGQEFRRGGRK